LSELFLKRQTLLINFTAKHPKVREIDDQIRAIIYEAKKQLKSLYNALQNKEKEFSDRLAELREANKRLPEKALQLVKKSTCRHRCILS
jgi:uncharacterized protein involved in exopolysaccharide biosynthesis